MCVHTFYKHHVPPRRPEMICHLEGWVGGFLGGSYGFQGGTEWDLSLPKEYEKGYYRKLNAI